MDELIEALRGLPIRTKSGQLRQLMPVIEERLAAGVAQQDIVDALGRAGIDMTLGTFKSYLHRHRAKLREGASEPVSAKPAVPRRAIPIGVGASPPEVSAEPETLDAPAQPSLAEIMDVRNRDAMTEKYMSSRRPLLRRNRS